MIERLTVTTSVSSIGIREVYMASVTAKSTGDYVQPTSTRARVATVEDQLYKAMSNEETCS